MWLRFKITRNKIHKFVREHKIPTSRNLGIKKGLQFDGNWKKSCELRIKNHKLGAKLEKQ